MNLTRKNNFRWNWLILAFLFPFTGMLFVMLISQYEPFGQYSMLYSDAYYQYYPFFVEFRNALRSGESLLHNWSVGLGIDYLSLIAYYLASPLNLLSVLVPESWTLELYSLLVPVRLGFAGLFFALFLKKMFGTEDISIAAFGSFYALCAWAMGYMWNIMWLDTFALLPLVALGTVQLLRDKKFILYTLALFAAILSNYYIGFFVCIFVFLLFFIYEVCCWQGIERFFADLCRIAVFSILAIGMTAILELPAYMALKTTQSSVNQFPKKLSMNIADEKTWKGFFDAMRKVAGNMGGGIKPTFVEGLPNLYCGVGSVMLAFLYLTSRKIKLREKICSLFLLIFFMVSFIVRQLDYIWHGFHFTNMIPYRFSFLFSFVLLYMAYRAWMLRHGFKLWQILAATLLSVGILLCSDERDNWVYLLYSFGFLALYAGALGYDALAVRLAKMMDIAEEKERKIAACHHRQYASILILVVMTLELACNLLSFGIYFGGTSVANYPRGTTYSASVIRYMKEREEKKSLFFRAETTHTQSYNDGALNGYNGVSTFTSSANVKVTEFMQTLGYGARNTFNRYCYEEASPVSNLFLNLKYMIERQGRDKSSAYFTQINRFGEAALLQNNYYLPLGFMTEEALADLQFDTANNGFGFQNQLIATASGVEGDVWHLLIGENLKIEGDGADITKQSSTGYCAYTANQKNASVLYTYQVDSSGFMCISVNLPKRNDVQIWVNDELRYAEAISLPQMLAVGDVSAGDVVQLKMPCKTQSESGTMSISAAVLNEQQFAACYDALSASTLELTKFSNTEVAGTITCDRDGLLYTSIPQNGNWYAEVDGQTVETLTVGDAMVALMLDEGTHEVYFYYSNWAFALGWKISALCAAVFAILIYRNKYYYIKKEKH